MKKLFQAEPLIEILNGRQLRLIGTYRFLEASERHCAFLYEDFSIKIQATQVHIDVLKDEEFIIHVEELQSIELKKQVNDYEKIR